MYITSTHLLPADAFHSSHLAHKNLIHQFMSNKSSSSSSNNHFHYHLYQYQTHNCCFNLFDHSKTSSTVTTAASNENFSSFQTQSIGNSCQTADFMQSRNTQNDDDNKSKTATSSKFNENPSQLTSSGSEFPSTLFNAQSRVNFDLSVGDETPSYDDNDNDTASKSQTAEKVIEIEYSNENYRKPDDDQDDCSCTKKYLPYKVNEKNVWQVYETSDCKYIQSKYEVDEIFQPPPSSGDTKTPSEYNPMLHSRSNFSNQVICHTINRSETAPTTDKSESVNSSTPYNLNFTSDSLYTPMFNIKSDALEGCQCIDEETEDTASKANDDDDDESVVSKRHFAPSPLKTSYQATSPSKKSYQDSSQSKLSYQATPPSKASYQTSSPSKVSYITSSPSKVSYQTSAPSKESYQANLQSGKLLNRPKATNNISRDQVKPVEKEVQNEITKNGVKSNSVKTLKPIRLPSPEAKHQSPLRRSKAFEDESESSESEFSSIESQETCIKEIKKSPKNKSTQSSPKENSNDRQQSSLVRQESKNVVIPNIHQGN